MKLSSYRLISPISFSLSVYAVFAYSNSISGVEGPFSLFVNDTFKTVRDQIFDGDPTNRTFVIFGAFYSSGIVLLYSAVVIFFAHKVIGRNYAFYKQCADNIYFLGFLLTLISLIFALSADRLAEGALTATSSLVQNAIALSSTAVALLIRTGWLMFVQELEGSEEAILEHEMKLLSEGFETLREGAESVSSNLKKSSIAIANTVSEFNNQLHDLHDSHFLKLDELLNEYKLAISEERKRTEELRKQSNTKTASQPPDEHETSLQRLLKPFRRRPR